MYGSKIWFFILFICFGIQGYSQESIAFRYDVTVVPKGDITVNHYRLLENKIKGSYSSSNIFTTQTPFSIIPKIQLVDVKNAGEMNVVKVVKVGVTLSVEDIDNNIRFKQYNTEVLGTDKDLSLAITKALNQIKPSSPKLKKFFEEAEESILSFYTNNCSKLLSTAKTHIEREQFNRAYALLKYVPENVSCYKEAERLITSIYNTSINKNCNEMLHKAQIEKANQNYERALKHLHYVDPSSSCYPKVEKLIHGIESLIDKQSSEKHTEERQKYAEKSAREKMKVLSMLADYLQIQYSKNEIDSF